MFGVCAGAPVVAVLGGEYVTAVAGIDRAFVPVIAAAILERYRLELAPGYRLETRQMPTIGPKHGLPVVPRAARGGPVAEPALAA